MGLAKQMMIEQDEQGWSYTDKHVCVRCVDDPSLQEAIRSDEDPALSCSFCSCSPAAPLNSLMAAFVAGLHNEYGDADNEGVMYDSAEGGYVWPRKWDTWDLVEDFGDVLVGEGLLDAVQESMHDRVWVERNFSQPRRDEALSAAWNRFCEAVKYETRYVFWLRKDEDEEEIRSWGEVPAAGILDDVGDLIERLELIKYLPAGYRLWRARPHKQPHAPWGASDLGTAPRDRAKQANRMSPAGIPMFYGAADSEAAVQEVAVRSTDPLVTVGAFETSKACMVVDFSALRPVPSMFDPEWGGVRRNLMFLHNFADQLSEPARETYEQIDYVPTQVVTEYLLRIFGRSTRIDGLLYRSALTDAVCAVLDVPHVRCVDQVEGWDAPAELRLGLMPKSRSTRAIQASS